MKKLNFKLSELIHSEKAIQHNINNMPDINSLDCMLDLIVFCLQPVRDILEKPMIISSGFRNEQLNKIVGGDVNSQHKKGQAVDFTVPGLSVNAVFNIIQSSKIEYDQLINEYNKWIHISFVRGKNRKKIIIKK